MDARDHREFRSSQRLADIRDAQGQRRPGDALGIVFAARRAEVLAIIQEAPKPVLISCRAGVDRTGVIAAAYRILVDGKSQEEAIKEMDGFHSPWDPLNNRYVRSITGARKARILANVTQWRSRLRPVGRFECRDGGCRLLVQ